MCLRASWILPLLLLSARPAAGALRQLHSHVPEAVSQLTSTGRLPATNELHLAIGLPLRNQRELDSLLQQLYDPAGPNYRRYLTPSSSPRCLDQQRRIIRRSWIS